MNKRLSGSALALAATLGLSLADAQACTPTGFVRDGINLTAALINPPGAIDGDVDATGCNIGIYYGPGARGSLDEASVHGANYYGVVNNGAKVDIADSTVYDIGETPLNGTQHGVAIYFAFASEARGDIKNNVMWNYQKGGIVVSGPLARAVISGNSVIGQGPVNFIAQNGIEVGFGADARVSGNLVVGNSYTGAAGASSAGVLLVGGDCFGGAPQTDTTVAKTVAVGNDVGVWFANLDAKCNPVTTPTRDVASGNTVRNNAVNNTSGDGPGAGYQAGIADLGDDDHIIRNSICGAGYTPVPTPPPFLFTIDVTDTNNPVVKDNVTCPAGPVTDTQASTIPDPPQPIPHSAVLPSAVR
jgi:hypothetical protein